MLAPYPDPRYAAIGSRGRPRLSRQSASGRAHVGVEGIHQDAVRREHVTGRLRGVERVPVDEQRARRHLLHVEHRADLTGDLVLDVVALVEHERDILVAVAAAAHHLEDDAEQLERVGRADDEVVVGVEPRVEVERAELAEAQQLHDDELDVRARGVVAGVEADLRTVTERGHLGVARSPVRNVHVVERRLEELVLEHEALVLADAVVDLRRASRRGDPAGRGGHPGPGSSCRRRARS